MHQSPFQGIASDQGGLREATHHGIHQRWTIHWSKRMTGQQSRLAYDQEFGANVEHVERELGSGFKGVRAGRLLQFNGIAGTYVSSLARSETIYADVASGNQ